MKRVWIVVVNKAEDNADDFDDAILSMSSHQIQAHMTPAE